MSDMKSNVYANKRHQITIVLESRRLLFILHEYEDVQCSCCSKSISHWLKCWIIEVTYIKLVRAYISHLTLKNVCLRFCFFVVCIGCVARMILPHWTHSANTSNEVNVEKPHWVGKTRRAKKICTQIKTRIYRLENSIAIQIHCDTSVRTHIGFYDNCLETFCNVQVILNRKHCIPQCIAI